MKRLLIAAGGGGDAIATSMVHAALYGADTPALVLTYAWERLVVDPVPGPRRPADFTGTVAAGPGLWLVTSQSAPRAPAGSLLPRLAGELRPELGLLDPYEGAVGLARQIRAAALHCGADRVDVVDVGGDVVADGTEPTLRSPLGDALALAACAAAGLPTTVHVAGPGLDSEVPEGVLLPRLGAPAFALTSCHALAVDRVFDWHPSEASALLVAAARGVRGVCGTRDAPQPVLLGPASAEVYSLSLARALELNPLARALAGTTDLAQAEAASTAVCGFSEIARERARALTPEPPAARPAGGDPAERFGTWAARTAAMGIEYVTTRRITEELALTAGESVLLQAHLRSAGRQVAPLWRLGSA
ncbi:hypothetical protein F4556_006943 [Kitasatospora gansuensis]|uniref:DUF1152 domain-containing protein n=1 Tax=Kitasatospora gansuensis TaxID=258050 RepID=A0A7W7SJ39_9ACTN|nr:DUF1152 domain-containing protein [Kitasatospora gansuensis]MBB4951408.1 hypothetical protein [Kitasatospora gansuensis]